MSRRESDEDAKAAEGAAQGHTFVQDGPSHSMAKSKNQHLLKYIIKGPLRQQPVERPLDPRYSCTHLCYCVWVWVGVDVRVTTVSFVPFSRATVVGISHGCRRHTVHDY